MFIKNKRNKHQSVIFDLSITVKGAANFLPIQTRTGKIRSCLHILKLKIFITTLSVFVRKQEITETEGPHLRNEKEPFETFL